MLVHAAAGGVGSLLTQWARRLGARVMGIVGTEAKAAIARRQGCHQVFVAGRDDIVASVRKYTRGQMADVVYDSVGKDTFIDSLDSLRPRGMMVSFGNASGPRASGGAAGTHAPRLAVPDPTRHCSITSPNTRSSKAAARALFALVKTGKLRVRSASATHCRMPRSRIAIWKRAAPSAPRC